MKRISIEVKGLVQGVGFRPFVYSLAIKNSLCGQVLNDSKGAFIEVEGDEKSIKLFLDQLHSTLPPLARIDTIKTNEMRLQGSSSFIIQKSVNVETKESLILPDMAICKECLEEMKDSSNRRYKYPFINCTNCGPRYSIIKNIPYDRVHTSMDKFTMCKECAKEYSDPLNRRYHAQPISCANCGPTLTFFDTQSSFMCQNSKAIEHIATLIKKGCIVAIKGVGGFHLVCDATNEKSLQKLRKFKHRPAKPFAVMCKDESMAKAQANLDIYEKEALNSIEKPIVLVQKSSTTKISSLVAPDSSRLGIFLPNTPLHILLFDFLDMPIVATSANLESEPIITTKELLDSNFFGLLGGILDYDRKIVYPSDDSVLTMLGAKKLYFRVSRGVSPLSIPYTIKNKKNILAVGAHTKNAIALYLHGNIILLPYLGDMNSVKTYELFEKTIASWKRFYNVDFDIIICDKHPAYTTTLWAKRQKSEIVQVNHYHAHILSTLVDQKIPLRKKVLGVAWDGTGYGDDGTIWGGEFLVCKGQEYERVAHFEPFKIIGSKKSIKYISRVAFSLLYKEGLDVSEFEEYKLLASLYEKEINTMQTSSVGRLFDFVCYMITGLNEVSYDGQSGLMLESLYDKNIEDFYTFSMEPCGTIKYGIIIQQIAKERHKKSLVATKFINGLVEVIVKVAQNYKLPIVVGGGVFQNKTLLLRLEKRCKDDGLEFYFPQTLTPNDGGICIGQIAYELAKKS